MGKHSKDNIKQHKKSKSKSYSHEQNNEHKKSNTNKMVNDKKYSNVSKEYNDERIYAQKEHGNTKVVKNQNLKEKEKNKKKKSKGKLLLKIFFVLLVLIVILFVSLYSFLKSKLKKLNYIELNETELGINSEIDDMLKDYRNIVLLGVDSRDMNNIKGSRTDSIIIVSISKKTKEIKLISVYRDTYMNIEGRGLDKVTHAHAFGGPTLTINTLNRNMDLNIKEFVTVNFKVVANLVDEIGGIELDIKQSEINEMNKYIIDTSNNTGIESKPITTAGLQTVDGVQAVTYSRIRKNTGGDERRNERMRTVLVKVFEKTKKMNWGTINKIADEILPNIQTNISADELMGMIPKVATYKINENTSWPYDTEGTTIKGVWYGVPRTLESNVVKLHKEVFNLNNYTASKTVKDTSSKIIKKTGKK